MNYYNEIEPYPAQWLRNLVDAGHIAPGYVDQRDIREVKPDDVKQYNQSHFFAGIGTWSHALRVSGWTDDRPVWTGSCPCQPFSNAGNHGGTNDPRHLWPEWFRLIRECKPPVIFGEQVASKDGLAWFDIVSTDLEGEGYSVAAFDLCAAGVGAPHLRQRLYFVADTTGKQEYTTTKERFHSKFGECSTTDILVHTDQQGWQRDNGLGETERLTTSGSLGDTDRERRTVGIRQPGNDGAQAEQTAGEASIQAGNFWSDAEWLWCKDGKYRPIKRGLSPLANGYPKRVAKLRAIGNAIVAPLATEFIRAYMDCNE